MGSIKQHANLSANQWFSYPAHQHVLMIAAELIRAKNWIGKGDWNHVRLCYERAFELTDLTVSDPKWRGRARELLRFREMLAELYVRPQKDEAMNAFLYKTLVNLLPGSCNALSPRS